MEQTSLQQDRSCPRSTMTRAVSSQRGGSREKVDAVILRVNQIAGPGIKLILRTTNLGGELKVAPSAAYFLAPFWERELTCGVASVRGEPMALVLIVEDETLVLVLAESIVQLAGHQTLSAGSYDGAVALLEQGARPDLAFLDRNLGEGLTGIDVARKARQYNPDIQVLYTSGDMTDGVEAMFVDGAEFLPKPYTDEQLAEAINKLLRNGTKA